MSVGHPKAASFLLKLTTANFKFVPLNPRPMLQSLVDQEIRVRLKWSDAEYTGRLVSADSYMNLQLSGAKEWQNGQSKGELGQVLIRCNNVLWIAKDGEHFNVGNAETTMANAD